MQFPPLTHHNGHCYIKCRLMKPLQSRLSGQCLQKYANSPQAIGKVRSYSPERLSCHLHNQSNTKKKKQQNLPMSFRRHVPAWTVNKYLNKSCVVLSFKYISKEVSFRSTGHTHRMEWNII